MKKMYVLLVVLLCNYAINAQQQGKMRVGFNLGATIPSGGVGFGGDIDARYCILDNLNVGLQLGLGGCVKDVAVDNFNQTASAMIGALSSVIVSGDYYINDGKTMFAPYVGGGFGLYNVGNVGLFVNGTSSPSNSSTVDPNLIIIERKFGGVIRAGFESGHFRLGMDYFLVPRSKANILDEQYNVLSKVETGNSVLRFTLGFYFWGGHWKKK